LRGHGETSSSFGQLYQRYAAAMKARGSAQSVISNPRHKNRAPAPGNCRFGGRATRTLGLRAASANARLSLRPETFRWPGVVNETDAQERTEAERVGCAPSGSYCGSVARASRMASRCSPRPGPPRDRSRDPHCLPGWSTSCRASTTSPSAARTSRQACSRFPSGGRNLRFCSRPSSAIPVGA
jgi:hypothetical protein